MRDLQPPPPSPLGTGGQGLALCTLLTGSSSQKDCTLTQVQQSTAQQALSLQHLDTLDPDSSALRLQEHRTHRG